MSPSKLENIPYFTASNFLPPHDRRTSNDKGATAVRRPTTLGDAINSQ